MKAFVSFLVFLSSLAAVLAGTNEAGLKFLEENKSKEGVVTLESGLQFKVLNKGTGTHHPTVNSPCSCHYVGRLIDGTPFDSSYDRGQPTTFAPNQVIAGWTEAMQLMVEGDKWEMYIPSELGYGDAGSPPKIPGGEVLVFQMEILEIKGDKVEALKCKITDGNECNKKELAYIKKVRDWEPSKVTSELDRLEKMEGSPMKDDLKAWLRRRIYILLQFSESKKGEEEL